MAISSRLNSIRCELARPLIDPILFVNRGDQPCFREQKIVNLFALLLAGFSVEFDEGDARIIEDESIRAEGRGNLASSALRTSKLLGRSVKKQRAEKAAKKHYYEHMQIPQEELNHSYNHRGASRRFELALAYKVLECYIVPRFIMQMNHQQRRTRINPEDERHCIHLNPKCYSTGLNTLPFGYRHVYLLSSTLTPLIELILRTDVGSYFRRVVNTVQLAKIFQRLSCTIFLNTLLVCRAKR